MVNHRYFGGFAPFNTHIKEKIMGSTMQSVAVLSAYVMMADGREDPEECIRPNNSPLLMPV